MVVVYFDVVVVYFDVVVVYFDVVVVSFDVVVVYFDVVVVYFDVSVVYFDVAVVSFDVVVVYFDVAVVYFENWQIDLSMKSQHSQHLQLVESLPDMSWGLVVILLVILAVILAQHFPGQKIVDFGDVVPILQMMGHFALVALMRSYNS